MPEASTPVLAARVVPIAVRSTAACTGSRSPIVFVSFISFSLSLFFLPSHGFVPGADGRIPEQAIAAYNQTYPDRPY